MILSLLSSPEERSIIDINAPIAQLDRASDYGSEGCRFDSFWARQSLLLRATSGYAIYGKFILSHIFYVSLQLESPLKQSANRAWRDGRAAECGGLENRYPERSGSWVRIPLSPPLFSTGKKCPPKLYAKADRQK
jgi:hypothetical protein